MGVPHFYTWLVNRYPLIKSSYSPETAPNIDWLFLDLNGIIYKCATDDTSIFKDILKGKKFEEIFVNILTQINEIIHLVQPKKLIYLAFDGVAPRAKMNQQRARRFKSARKYSELDKALQDMGIIEKEEHFKNNSISPGTEFMFELNKQIKFFIQKKIYEDERWRDVQIVFSGVDNPGEGEHKALEYIRRRVQEDNFDPNTSICIYGPDADLIFLALTTHLPFVCILREQLKPRTKKSSATKRYQNIIKYDFLWINIFREYFELEFGVLSAKMGKRYNIDHIIDDFIFLCFFIGNDFLPRVFCMDIKVGNFDILIEIFKEILVESDGYINEKGIINWKRAVVLFKKIANFELKFIGDKLHDQKAQQKQAYRSKNTIREEGDDDDAENLNIMKEVDNIPEESDDDGNDNEDYEDNEPEDDDVDRGGKKHKKINVRQNDPEKLKALADLKRIDSENPQSLGQEEHATTERKETLDYIKNVANEELTQRLLSANVLERDIKFMDSLVKLYKMDASDARKLYYQEKFNIDISKDDKNGLTHVLTSYMQGLQFVLSYYYTNCPSWNWYYPYYYSPLVSDLSTLMTHLKLPDNNYESLISFELGKPYDPFKQLLLILPAASSHLLPEPFRNLVSDPNAPLHPFYPLEFVLDPFGAVFDSEYIAKIPFVDDAILTSEYEKALKNVSSEDSLRNDHQENLQYEYETTLKSYKITSELPMYFEDFESKAKVQYFDLFKMKFDPKRILTEPPKGANPIHLSFPSLEFILKKKSEMIKFNRRDATFNKCTLTIPNPFDNTDLSKVVGKYYYFNYPFLKECFLMAVFTKEEMISHVRYQDLPLEYDKSQHKKFYLNMNENVADDFFNEQGIQFDKLDPAFAIIQYQDEPRKDSEGKIFWPNPQWNVIPLNLIIVTKLVPTYRGFIDFSPKKIEKEFPRDAEAALFTPQLSGAKVRIVGYKNVNSGTNVKVDILSLTPNLSSVIKSISKRFDNQTNYRDCRNVAKELGVDIEVLHIIFDSIIVKSDPNDNSKNIFPEKFDIGLGWIQKKYHTIVPELIICHELNQRSRTRAFPEFQLAPEAVSIIKEYLRLFPNIFNAIKSQIQSRDYNALKAKDIYPHSKHPNIEVFKIFIWAMKQDSSNLIVSNKASKVIPRQGIVELEKILEKQSILLGDKEKELIGKTFDYNPNSLIVKNHDVWIPPFFSRMPAWHNIGDRVVNLKTTGNSFAPFAASGTVVGILGNKKEENGIYENKVEVLFDKPFIGGTNLGGRCKWGRGSIVDFDDIFNITLWKDVIVPRYSARHSGEGGWDGHFSRPYIPEFTVGDEEVKDNQNERPQTRETRNEANAPSNHWDQKKSHQEKNYQEKNYQEKNQQETQYVPKQIKQNSKDTKSNQSNTTNTDTNEKKVISVAEIEGSKTEQSSSTNQSSFDINSFISNNSQVQSKVSGTKQEVSSQPKEQKKLKVRANNDFKPVSDTIVPNDPAIISVNPGTSSSSTNALAQDLQKILNIQPENSQAIEPNVNNLGTENVKKLLNIVPETQDKTQTVNTLASEDLKKMLNIPQEPQANPSEQSVKQDDPQNEASKQDFQNLINKILPNQNKDTA